MQSIVPVLLATVVLSFGSGKCINAQSQHHVVQAPAEAQWGPAPPMLPAGAKIAVLAGNPTLAEPYTVRLKFPAHYQIPSHSHPTDENIVVVSGSLTFGMGDKLSQNAAENKALSSGGFALMPAHMNHFAYAGAEPTVIVLYGQGPVEFKYVNPDDDPRKPKSTARRTETRSEGR